MKHFFYPPPMKGDPGRRFNRRKSMNPIKFEDLVKFIVGVRSEFDLASMPLATVQQGLTDLQTRLQALEAAAKSSAK